MFKTIHKLKIERKRSLCFLNVYFNKKQASIKAFCIYLKILLNLKKSVHTTPIIY